MEPLTLPAARRSRPVAGGLLVLTSALAVRRGRGAREGRIGGSAHRGHRFFPQRGGHGCSCCHGS
ncbi:MAG: hypothetical protein MZV70_55840 [Desulfobacterales bacterium]|nr:hypothetical protein [Desulfobacterales bacterium]